MRTIEIRRHSFTKKGAARGRGSHLSVEGIRAAREIGPRLGHFDHVVASTSPRTMETAIAMGFAVDELIEMPSPVETGEIGFHEWREWPDPFTTLRIKAHESDAVAKYIAAQADGLLTISRQIDDGARVLVVGHGGWIESVIVGLLDPALAPALGGSFWHLDGICLSIGATSSVTLEAVDRYPR